MQDSHRVSVVSVLRFARAKYHDRQPRRESTCEEAAPSNRIYQGCVGTRELRIGAGHVSSWVATHFRIGKIVRQYFPVFEFDLARSRMLNLIDEETWFLRQIQRDSQYCQTSKRTIHTLTPFTSLKEIVWTLY